MSDAPNPPPAPAPEPAPAPAAPAPAAPLPAVKNRGGLALVAGVAVVGLGIYVLQPSDQAPATPAAASRVSTRGQPPMLNNPNLVASRARMQLSPAQVEAIRAVRRGGKNRAEIGPDGKLVVQPAAAIELTKDEVQATLRVVEPEVRGCFPAGQAGVATVAFTLHKDPERGAYARDAALADATLKTPAVESCVVEHLNRTLVPELKGRGEVRVRYPITLAQDGAGEAKP